MNAYYQAGAVTIYHGDCQEILPNIPSYDLVFTSPPYNLGGAPWPHLGHWKQGDIAGGKSKWRQGGDSSGGLAYSDHEDTMPHAQYVQWQQQCLLQMWAGLSDTGAIFYNHRPRVIGTDLWLPTELNPGLPLRQIVIWARAGGTNYTPVAFVPTHEWIMVLAKPAWRLRNQSASGLGDVWRIPQEPNAEHPCPFPIKLPARAISATSATCVLDPFMGIGSSLVAAKNAGLATIGIEKTERYCEVAARRLETEGWGIQDMDRGRRGADTLF